MTDDVAVNVINAFLDEIHPDVDFWMRLWASLLAHPNIQSWVNAFGMILTFGHLDSLNRAHVQTDANVFLSRLQRTCTFTQRPWLQT